MGKVLYIHYLRGVAAFFIVAIHYNLFSSNDSLFGRASEYFLLEWTAIFVMISGFLFQYLINKYNFKKFIFSKFKYVILPYTIISIPAILIYMVGIKNDHGWVDIPELMTNSKAYVILFFYSTGSHLGPLWFIPVLILIFFTSKPLSLIGKNESVLNIFALLSVLLILSTSRPSNDSNVFLSYVHFLPVYIIGMFLCSKKDFLVNQKNKNLFLCLFIFLFLVGVIFKLSASYAILTKIPLFLFLCVTLDALKNENVRFILSMLADVSFAIYFLHGYFVGVARKFITVFQLSFNDTLGMSITVLLTIVTISLLTGLWLIMRKFSIPTRIFIGS